MAPVLQQDRGDSCFFVEYREGMSFEGAEDLFRLHNDNRQLKRSYRYTKITLGVASAGIVVTIVGIVVNVILNLR